MSRAGTVTGSRPRLAAIWSALAAVYVIWGTTYLAIRVVNQTLPPLLAASVRFLVAGALLYAWAVRRGDVAGDRPTRAH
jgi:drug/metabolite transporter (DMT)-like permease